MCGDVQVWLQVIHIQAWLNKSIFCFQKMNDSGFEYIKVLYSCLLPPLWFHKSPYMRLFFKIILWLLFMGGVHCLKALWGDSSLFTNKSPGIPGTLLIDLRRKKSYINLGPTQRFWTRDPWVGHPMPWPLGHCPIEAMLYSFAPSIDRPTTKTSPQIYQQ